MNRAVLCAVLATPMLLAGCRSRFATGSPSVRPPSQMYFEALTRSQYEVLGRAEGQACAEMYALWPLPIVWIVSDDHKGWPRPHQGLFTLRVSRRAAASASYQAINNQPEADTILFPRYREVSEAKGIWYRKSCVGVEGKAVRLKLDRELSPEQMQERPQTSDTIVRE